jgi:hypothetical protein
MTSGHHVPATTENHSVLTNYNVDPAVPSCEIGFVISRAQANTHRAPVVPIPVFDENRRLIIGCFQAVGDRGSQRVLPVLTGAYDKVRRVKNSLRHARLAEFLHHAIVALESDQPEGAKYILLTALATFGWPSDLPEYEVPVL